MRYELTELIKHYFTQVDTIVSDLLKALKQINDAWIRDQINDVLIFLESAKRKMLSAIDVIEEVEDSLQRGFEVDV